MPFIIPAIIAGGAAGIGISVVSAFGPTLPTLAFGFSWSAFATTAILGGLSQALAPDPQEPSTGSGVVGSQGRLVTVRQPIGYRQVIVGRCRVGGNLTYIEEIGSDLHLVITWAGHRCQEIEAIYFDDELIPIDGSGDASSGTWAESSITEMHQVSWEPPYTFTLDHTPISIVSVRRWYSDGETPIVDVMTDVSPAAPEYAPPEYSISGATITVNSFFIGQGGFEVRYNATVADVPPPSGTNAYVRIQHSLGDEAAGVQPFADLVTASDGKWTNDHTQTGCCKSYIRLTSNPEMFPRGLPNITAVIKGALIEDPRQSPMVTSYSNNPALWIAHYLANTDYGLGADYSAEIDETDLVAAANVCDESVALAGSPSLTESRYTANGAFLTSEKPRDVIKKLLDSMSGKALPAGEKWHIHAGAYEVPTITIDEDDYAGPLRTQPMVSRRDSCNGVKGIFTDEASSWQPTDFPAYPEVGSAYDVYVAQDNNERVWRDLDLSPFVTSGTQAQRLAKIELMKIRLGLSDIVPCKLTAYAAMTGRTVARTDAQFSWTDEPFEVDGSRFSVDQDGRLGVELSLRKTSADVYAWATAEEQPLISAGVPVLPDAYQAPAPQPSTVVVSTGSAELTDNETLRLMSIAAHRG